MESHYLLLAGLELTEISLSLPLPGARILEASHPYTLYSPSHHGEHCSNSSTLFSLRLAGELSEHLHLGKKLQTLM